MGTSTGDRRRAGISGWLARALRDVAYDVAILGWSVVAFTVLVVGITVTASLLVLVVGVVAWVAFVSAMRWTTWVDRRLAGWQRREPVVAAIGVTGAYLSMPLWYWAISDPGAHDGFTDLGLFVVDDLGRAAVVAAVGLALVPAALALASRCAAMHARLASQLLGRTA